VGGTGRKKKRETGTVVKKGEGRKGKALASLFPHSLNGREGGKKKKFLGNFGGKWDEPYQAPLFSFANAKKEEEKKKKKTGACPGRGGGGKNNTVGISVYLSVMCEKSFGKGRGKGGGGEKKGLAKKHEEGTNSKKQRGLVDSLVFIPGLW